MVDRLVGRQNGIAFGCLVTLLLTIAIEQHDAVVEREHHLQDRSDIVGGDADAGQQGIGAHVEQDGNAGGEEYDKRLDPRLRHDNQYDQDERGCDDDDR